MKKNIIAILALLLIAGWGIYDYSHGKKKPASTHDQALDMENIEVGIQKGNRAPDFQLLNLDGEEVRLSDYLGKKVILNFWATWCPPCRAEMPHMEKVYKKNQDDVVILAVNLTHTEKSTGDVQDFVKDYKLTFPIAMDTKGEVTGEYQVFAYPTSLMIDSQGVIHEIYRGAINEDIMKKSLAAMN